MKLYTKVLAIFMAVILNIQLVFLFASAKESQGKPVNIKYKNIPITEISKKDLDEKKEGKLTFIENSKSNFIITLPQKYDESLLKAAEVLANVIYEMSGFKIKIVDNKKEAAFAVNIINENDTSAGNDGYTVEITDNKINILGKNTAGARNGIYGFIEDYLGCMFLTSSETFIPKHKSIYLEKGVNNHTPKMLWRDVYTYEASFDGWADKLRLNAIDSKQNPPTDNIEKNHHYDWGTWCHNCYTFLSPQEYFDKHPEYFSEVKGKRLTSYKGRDAYLCLSNPDVLKIVKDEMKNMMKENPEKIYWDFSGSDNPSLAGCLCENCAAMDKAAGGTGMGSLMPFLNSLAKEFPDKYISTLAYLHTVEAPKNIKLEENIVIKLCSMPGDQAYSYLNGGTGTADNFKKQVEDWSAISDKIIVWDYIVNFSNLLLPFPNFAVQVENQKFYEENNVMGVFHQGSREKGGELAELRTYVLARLLWEGSSMDVAECVSKYITAYFGKAAPMVVEYMNILSSSLYESENTLGLYDSPEYHRGDYLSYENLMKYKNLVEEAKVAVKDSPVYMERLEKIEIPVLYCLMSHPKINREERLSYKNQFNKLCDKNEITKLREWQTREDFFKNDYEKIISNERLNMYKPYIVLLIIVVIVVLALLIALAVKKYKKKKQK